MLRCAFLMVLVGVALTGCSTPPEPATLQPSLSSIQTFIFDSSCADSTCHSATAHAGNLVLEKGQSYAQLVDVFADNAAAKNAGLKRVLVGDPDSSFLLTKVNKIVDLNHGQVMPPSMPEGLAAAQLAAIRDWIVAGANDD